jgi:hypothetical protein
VAVRQVLAGLAAVLVVAVAVVTVLRTLDERERAPLAAADVPDRTAEAYLEAWAAADHDAMLELVRDPPASFVADHDQLLEGLGVDGLTVALDELVEDVDGRATAQGTVTAEVAIVGPVSWEVELQLLRERGAWGVAWTPAALHPDWRPGLRFVTSTVATERAPVLAADGTPLAGPGQRVTFGFEPGAVRERDEVVEAFEAAVPGAGGTADRLLGQGGLVDGWFYPVVSVSADAAGDAWSILTGTPGVLRRTDDGARSLLADGFAVHAIGRTGEATAEELARLGPPYEPGDVIGRTGLEAVLERRLAEREEVRIELRDGDTGPVRATLGTAAVRDGEPVDTDVGPVTTTLDVTVQRAIENTLVGRDQAAAIVVVDATDGAVRGTASRPIDGFNRAFEGRYPAGTAIAPVVVDALTAAGGDPTDPAACPVEAIVAGRAVTNADEVELGEVPVVAAAAGGCSTTLARIGSELGAEALTEAAARFGAGEELGLPIAANGLSYPEPVDAGDAAVSAAGQGRVEVSPLHLATVAAAASTGSWWTPYLLEADGPGTATSLAPGALDGTRRLFVDDVGDGLSGFAAGARGFDGSLHRWFVGTVDDLGVAILLEDEGEGTDDPRDLAVRFARELRAVAAAPTDD